LVKAAARSSRCSTPDRNRDAPALIKKLNDAVNAALGDPDVRGKIVKSGAVPVGGTPEALAAFMRAEYDKWGRVVREHGIKETP
jgi:tripartite-type tricarboxylate transporter receptor subunit TctC